MQDPMRTDIFEELSACMAGPSASPRALPGREDDALWNYVPPSYRDTAVLLRPTREPFGFES